MPVDHVERLGLVRAALSGLGDGNPVALATARSLLEARDLTLAEARVRLKAEEVILEGFTAKGRGGKAIPSPGAAPAPAAPAAPGAPGEPNQGFDQLHPRGTGGVFVRKGDSGSHVQAMQARLTELGHPAGTDGKFGPKEQASVKAFQKQHGMPQTGIVDQTTLEAMRLPPTMTKTQSSAQLRAAIQAAGQTSAPGDMGENVSTLQSALMTQGFQITDPQATYGPSTEAAVRQLQQRAGLAPTGRMDEQTAAVLAAATPAMENHGNLAGDDKAAWGLKPQPGRKQHGGGPAAVPAPRGNPRSKPNPTPRQGAPKGGSVKVQQGSYEGSSSVGGGIDPFVAKTARILDMKPPNLREAPKDSFAACASCVFMTGSSCLKYGEYPVDRDDLCDSWLTLTPEQDRPKSNIDDGGVSSLLDNDDLAEAKLDAKARDALPSSAFALPGSREYPIHDESHARNALARAAGKPEEGKVKAAVKKKYPGIGVEEAILVARDRRFDAVTEALESGELEEFWSEAAREAALAARRLHLKPKQTAEQHKVGDVVQVGDTGVHGRIEKIEGKHAYLSGGDRVGHDKQPLSHLRKPRSVRESLDVSEVKSSAYPDLSRTNDDPNANWVAKAGGLPSYIERIAKHLHYEQGKSISEAIQIAVGVVKRWCGGGSVSTKGGASASHVTAKTKAQACAAVASWEAKKAKSKASTAAKKVAEGLLADIAPASIEEALNVEVAMVLESRPTIMPPSLRYCERLLAAVQEAHDDWDEQPKLPPNVVWAEEAAWNAAPAHFDADIEPFAQVVEGTPILFVAGCPVRAFGTVSEAMGKAAAARTFSVGVRNKNAKRTKERTSGSIRRGLHPTESVHNEADVAVHAVVSRRFAGSGAKPRTLAADAGGSSPDLQAGSGKGALVEGGAAGRSSRLIAVAESMFLDGRAVAKRVTETVIEEGLFDPIKHPRGRGGVFRETFGHGVAELADRVNGTGGGGTGLKSLAAPEMPKSDALVIDQAIGKVLQGFPGIDDWKVERAPDGEWHVHVTVPGGDKHEIHVTNEGDVHLAGDHGKTAAMHVPPSAPEPPKGGGGGYELSGGEEKPYHMADGQVFQGKKGGWFTKLEHGSMTSAPKPGKAQGWTGAGVHIHDHQTGEQKWVPAFAMKDYLPLAHKPGEGPAKPAEKPLSAIHSDLMSSVTGHGAKVALSGGVSLAGKNVVVTGKIPGLTRPEVHALLKAKGATPHSSVGSDTHILITGEKVGATKTNAAAKKGVQVVDWNDVAHLLESLLTPRASRYAALGVELAEADAGEARVVAARLAVLEGRLDDADRDALAILRPSGLARFGVRRVTEARLR